MNIGLTLIGQMITFLLFVLFTKRYVWPPLQKALQERQAKIVDGLAAAERGHHDLALAQEAAAKQIKTAKGEAAEILDGAKKQAASLIDTAKEQAREEGQRLLEKAEGDVEQMFTQAREQLRKQVANIAILGAEKVLERQVDEASNQALLDKLVNEL